MDPAAAAGTTRKAPMATSVSRSPDVRRAVSAASEPVKSPAPAEQQKQQRSRPQPDPDAESPRLRPQPSAEAPRLKQQTVEAQPVGSAVPEPVKHEKRSDSSDVGDDLDGDDVECVATPQAPASLRTAVPKPADSTSSGAGGDGAKPKPTAKRMLQATLSFTDGTVEQQLRKELVERDAKIEELQAKLQTAESALASHAHGRAETTEHLDDLEARLCRYQEAMKQLMVETARSNRRDARRWQHQQHFELGHIAPMSNPVNGMTEVWVEGNTARRLMNSVNDIRARQKEIEARRPAAKGARGKVGRGGGETDDDSAMLDADEEAEMRKMELAALRAAEQQVLMQKQQYREDIDAFVKEVRRIHEEDASPFALSETIGPVVQPEQGADGSASTLTSSALSAPAGMTSNNDHITGGTGGPDGPRHQERYVMVQLLGRGGFSEVWKAFDLIEGRYVACKVHKVNRQWSAGAQRNYLKHAERELEIQRQLDHPRLMKLYDVFQYDSTTFVSVMEYSGGEDLERRLKRCRTLREPEARIILMQVLSALRHLAEQSKPVIHYDLKPANIIFHSALASCLEVKVTDFGLSKVINDVNYGMNNDPSVELTSQQCGTFYYLPPEVFSAGAKISAKVDIWACGVIFYQMLYGRRPFASEASQADIYANKLIVSHARKGVDFPAKPPVSDEAKSIIRKCLTFEVADRPTLRQLCDEPYFHSRRSTAKRARPAVVAPSGSAMMALPRSDANAPSHVMPPPA
jgi:tousled-like kinase